jgi:hypothetical protein
MLLLCYYVINIAVKAAAIVITVAAEDFEFYSFQENIKNFAYFLHPFQLSICYQQNLHTSN